MKSIYDEAIELRNRLSNDGTGDIYEEDYLLLDRILDELERSKKVEELLGLYRKHINTLCKKDREGVKNSLFSSEHLAYELYEKIKQLEEE